MSDRTVHINRVTKETNIDLTLNLSGSGIVKSTTGIPYLDHMFTAMAFHGKFDLEVVASGDIEVDEHHLVEDLGLVLGEALKETVTKYGGVKRYSYKVIPMDEALSEVVIDVCMRPYLVYNVNYPQERSGNFEMHLLREFFHGLTSKGAFTLHAICRYGENSHHMSEALFKALGMAIKDAYTPIESGTDAMSTKGKL
ncbi:imidazoleglycerol-phosphate dehydratase HisB [Thiospirochaeta perfilievii]|uniref:Imidazoleglycerol-phosphate dehydratase n=1 Tax=Thiospirochaeta perfilievii TaxID=252967 RepID=A0A5C1QF92_9SPIO|nr:imidazoleglycerol-phosphate dehydratase HisB [Thiospirochaeta perfilievii]QEN06087.1 imidazoleglycerol-phosphate dehydratase HisB [Thiospirochaeta perfilievii]